MEAVASGLVEVLVGNLEQLISVSWNCGKEIRKLKSTLETIKAVLQDAEQLQISSNELRLWLSKLQDAAYDADDLLEEFAAETLIRKQRQQVSNCFLLSWPFLSHLKTGSRIKKIRHRFDNIAEERLKFHLRSQAPDVRAKSSERQQSYTFVDESQVYGRENDKRNILQLLMNDSSDEKCSVISIIGMCGIGKTTVANLIYNDEKVMRYFNLRIWFRASDVDDERMTWEVLEYLHILDNYLSVANMNLMKQDFKKMMLGKRFLFILDDVWKVEHLKWNDLKRGLLNCGQKGSRILVTTQDEKVARVMNARQYHLQGLSNDDSWALFKEMAFGSKKEGHPNLEAIGREIMKKCAGVPLAAMALGSMMRHKTEESQWQSIKDSNLWNLLEDENYILPALRLSYNHLPPRLRQCFVYFAIFPKGYEMQKDELLQLWMANGFVPSKRNMKLEDAAEEMFSDLFLRSFFHDVKRNEDGKIVNFKLHALMHDLAQVLAGNDCANVRADQSDTIREGIRHVTCDVRPLLGVPSELHKARALRTFLLLSNAAKYVSSRADPVNNNFRFLRVLGLSQTSIVQLPISTANLRLLRYLDLSYTNIKELPESFSELQNLQTLLLKGCERLVRLPKRISKITSLRCLDIDGCQLLTYMPSQIRKLTQLQRLTGFIVGTEGACVGELQGLQLCGKLHVRQIENVRGGEDASEARLKIKTNLQCIVLSWTKDRTAKMPKNDKEVLNALQPNRNLKRLTLKDYTGTEFPSWLRNFSCSNLVEISFIRCKAIQHLPPLGALESLQVLHLEGLDSLNKIDQSLYGENGSGRVPFQSLTKLTLRELPNLEEWDSMVGRQAFPCLSKLTIVRCSKLRTIPDISSVQRLVLRNTNEMLLDFVSRMTSLSLLTIGGFPQMTKLPEGMLRNLSNLQAFKIQDCPMLCTMKEAPRDKSSFNPLIWNCEKLASAAQGTMWVHSLSTS